MNKIYETLSIIDIQLSVFLMSTIFSALNYIQKNYEEYKEERDRMLVYAMVSGLFGVVIFQYLVEFHGFDQITNVAFSVFGSMFLGLFMKVINRRFDK